MFCPTCRDEYRPGFTRCATCDVDLVDSLDGDEPAAQADEAPDPSPRAVQHEPTSPYCGFLTLEEARDAKARMRAAGFPAAILIRDGRDANGNETEEYWLVIPQRAFAAALRIIGFDHAEPAVEEVLCSMCDRPVREDAESCPYCGARFEDE